MTELIYMAHPVSGDVAGNIIKAKAWRRRLQLAYPQACVIAPWIEECETFDDSNPELRAAGLERCKLVISRCDTLIVVGVDFTPGISIEVSHAVEHCLDVYSVVENVKGELFLCNVYIPGVGE